MKPAEVDWRYLRQDTIVPLVTLAVAVVLSAASYWFVGAEKERYARISVDQDVINADYDALILRKRLVDRYHRRYERFQEQGFIGTESRLDWIETLRVAAAELKLPSLTYAVEPQLGVLAPVPSTSAETDIQIFSSRLELELGLVHELDLVNLFDRLQSAAPGLVKVDRCSMQRRSEPDALQTADPNILAMCSLHMFSIITSDVIAEGPAP